MLAATADARLSKHRESPRPSTSPASGGSASASSRGSSAMNVLHRRRSVTCASDSSGSGHGVRRAVLRGRGRTACRRSWPGRQRVGTGPGGGDDLSGWCVIAPGSSFVAVWVVGDGAGGVEEHRGALVEAVGGQSGSWRWFGSPVRAKLSQASLITAATASTAGWPSRSGTRRLSNTRGRSMPWVRQVLR